jgi:hypothetical protein
LQSTRQGIDTNISQRITYHLLVHHHDHNMTELTMNSMLNTRALISKISIKEHMQSRHSNTLTPGKSVTRLRFLEFPMISSTSIKKNGDKE